MIKKNFIGVMTPCVAAALFMSGIMFTGCSKDDDFEDWDEETVQTLAEQRMTRSAESTRPPVKPNEIETKYSIAATFLFSGYRKPSIPGSALIDVYIKTDTLGKYKNFSYASYPDSYTSISNVSVLPGATGQYTVIVTANYTRKASYNSSTYTTGL